MKLMLKPGLAQFQRTANATVYQFPPQVQVEVADDDLPVMEKLLGHVLVVPKGDTIKADFPATAALKAMLQEQAKPKAKKSK